MEQHEMENNIKAKPKNKLSAILLAIVMTFALIPAIATPASATTTPPYHLDNVYINFEEPIVDEIIKKEQYEELSNDLRYSAFVEKWYIIDEYENRCPVWYGEEIIAGTYEVIILIVTTDENEWRFNSNELTIVWLNSEEADSILIADYVAGGANMIEYLHIFTVKAKDVPPEVPVVTPSAFVEQLKGNQNALTITVTERFSDGSTNVIIETFMINNNAAGTYTVGNYRVFVETKGNTQIRSIYIS